MAGNSEGRHTEAIGQETAESVSSGSSAGDGRRLLSLDVLRGIAILIMLLVNHFGPISIRPVQLRHAGWNETIHIADMAFPWFIFCVGVSIPFSIASLKRRNLPARKYKLRILRRVLILLVLGAILVSSGDNKLIFFSMGILQIIAIAYAGAALLYGLPPDKRLLLAFVILAIYWGVIKYYLISGTHSGIFEIKQNFVMYLNTTYLDRLGLWNFPIALPTTALALIGTAAGDIIRNEDMDACERDKVLMLSGVVLVILGLIWSISLQINKPLWTPSYILFSAGTGSFLLGLFHLIIDVNGRRKWAFPLIVFGSNAILAYILPTLMKSLILRPLGVTIAGWGFIIPYILFWWVILWMLYRRKVFFRV